MCVCSKLVDWRMSLIEKKQMLIKVWLCSALIIWIRIDWWGNECGSIAGALNADRLMGQWMGINRWRTTFLMLFLIFVQTLLVWSIHQAPSRLLPRLSRLFCSSRRLAVPPTPSLLLPLMGSSPTSATPAVALIPRQFLLWWRPPFIQRQTWPTLTRASSSPTTGSSWVKWERGEQGVKVVSKVGRSWVYEKCSE